MSKAKRNENKICVAICLAVPVKMTKESKMSYKKAAHVLPEELLRKVQEYVDGEFIYILRASDNKKGWGETTTTRQELHERNEQIYAEYLAGQRMEALADKYFLSLKSIQRIIRQLKKEHSK